MVDINFRIQNCKIHLLNCTVLHVQNFMQHGSSSAPFLTVWIQEPWPPAVTWRGSHNVQLAGPFIVFEALCMTQLCCYSFVLSLYDPENGPVCQFGLPFIPHHFLYPHAPMHHQCDNRYSCRLHSVNIKLQKPPHCWASVNGFVR